jgi:hypothetical protein
LFRLELSFSLICNYTILYVCHIFIIIAILVIIFPEISNKIIFWPNSLFVVSEAMHLKVAVKYQAVTNTMEQCQKSTEIHSYIPQWDNLSVLC